ncbi:MAG: adenylate kinase [Bacteroidales bacterium]|nr:adenylate kinase [Bacteroidales bacterium]
MIILITGASHTGKTLLAQRMLEKYKYPYFSINQLKKDLIRNGDLNLSKMDDNGVKAYLWPIVRKTIMNAIEKKQDLIVEGCYVPFDWRKDFGEKALKNIKFICLAMSGSYIDKHFGRSWEDEVDSVLARVKEGNRLCSEGFLQAGERVTLIDESYELAIDGIMNY